MILYGAPVADSLNEKALQLAADLTQKGIVPTVATVRVGEKSDDIVYEKNIQKRGERVHISVRSFSVPASASENEILSVIDALNKDPLIHGILLLRPLPKTVNENNIRNSICPKKDIDACTDISLGNVFVGNGDTFVPCTAQAVMETLEYYHIDPAGKRVAVVGRSLVIGRPVAMLLLQKNATVTVCHSKTQNIDTILRQSDIAVYCTGKARAFGKESFCDGQVVVDTGINWCRQYHKLCGDTRQEDAEAFSLSITPVPGGIGTVTSSVLMYHAAVAALQLADSASI